MVITVGPELEAALNDLARKMPLDGVRFDDGQRPLGHPRILSQRLATLKGSPYIGECA